MSLKVDPGSHPTVDLLSTRSTFNASTFNAARVTSRSIPSRVLRVGLRTHSRGRGYPLGVLRKASPLYKDLIGSYRAV